MKIESNYSLFRHNTFKLKLNTRLYIEYDDEYELDEIFQKYIVKDGEKVFAHIGRGSNVVFTEDYYNGIILSSAIRNVLLELETEGDVYLQIGAGALWDDFVLYATSHKWYGVENLSGIPGYAGACALQNIGAYGVEIKDVLEWVEIYDVETRQVRRLLREECLFDYRKSALDRGNQWVILRMGIRLSKSPVAGPIYEEIRTLVSPYASSATIRRKILAIRGEKLPSYRKQGNAGSFFVNPLLTASEWDKLQGIAPDLPHFTDERGRTKVSAARLIELCGLKGASNGSVGVSNQHALVLVNLGGARGQDVTDMATRVWEAVYERFGLSLQAEVKLISANENNFPWYGNFNRHS
ncbi:MAG: UDP-N-acetylmuramate dehydrogenase [Tannerellaceae bacterium]|jgi:UDP-N-acetylmuramate dehydrogenase|nr:UDP-N-acetylmuramate dehydrogenase [Tannerellaceae bacterium]